MINRFEPKIVYTNYFNTPAEVEMVESSDGEWVKYEDAKNFTDDQLRLAILYHARLIGHLKREAAFWQKAMDEEGYQMLAAVKEGRLNMCEEMIEFAENELLPSKFMESDE